MVCGIIKLFNKRLDRSKWNEFNKRAIRKREQEQAAAPRNEPETDRSALATGRSVFERNTFQDF